jgi:hypothetical protein
LVEQSTGKAICFAEYAATLDLSPRSTHWNMESLELAFISFGPTLKYLLGR